MKRLFFAAVLVLTPTLAHAANGTVSFLEGTATRTSAKGEKAALKDKSEVMEGDLVETGANARLELTMPDDSKVRMGPASKLKLDKAQFTDSGRDFKARLVLGKVWSKVSSMFGSDQAFEVKTDRAVAGVRGTVFRVDTDKSKAVLVKVYAGTVAVAGNKVMQPTVAPKKGERVQVAGPQQVSKEQWEKIVGAMMQVRVAANGEPEDPQKFSEESESKDAWAMWNKERDEQTR